MNAIFQGALDIKQVDKDICMKEINELIKWQEARKQWHSNKTGQKMAAEGTSSQDGMPGMNTFKSSDLGLHEVSAYLVLA